MTLIVATVLITSCQKEANSELKAEQDVLITQVVERQQEGGNSPNGRFSSNDCTESKVYCLKEVVVTPRAMEDIHSINGDVSGTVDFFSTNYELYSESIPADYLNLLVSGTTVLKFKVVTEEVNYFSIMDMENGSDLSVIPFRTY
ncbi:MAG: hypothetical protein AB8G15_17435 [Saprospiraceae bacterium]